MAAAGETDAGVPTAPNDPATGEGVSVGGMGDGVSTGTTEEGLSVGGTGEGVSVGSTEGSVSAPASVGTGVLSVRRTHASRGDKSYGSLDNLTYQAGR